jgi:hypothetical protein
VEETDTDGRGPAFAAAGERVGGDGRRRRGKEVWKAGRKEGGVVGFLRCGSIVGDRGSDGEAKKGKRA